MIGHLRGFSRVWKGSLKNHTGIIKGSNCNQISILKGSHHDLDIVTCSRIKSRLQLDCIVLPVEYDHQQPLSGFGSPVLYTVVQTDDITDSYCISSSALTVCLFLLMVCSSVPITLHHTAYPPLHCLAVKSNKLHWTEVNHGLLK